MTADNSAPARSGWQHETSCWKLRRSTRGAATNWPAGAIVGVVVQLAPVLRDRAGRMLHPDSVAGLVAGIAALYLTGLLINV